MHMYVVLSHKVVSRYTYVTYIYGVHKKCYFMLQETVFLGVSIWCVGNDAG